MQPISFESLELEATTQEGIDGAHWLGSFPFNPERPGETVEDSDEYTLVYNELEPGARIGTHRDSVDELVFVIEGTVEATVDGESVTATAGELAVVPAETPHSVRNTGSATAELLGFFATGDVDSTFEKNPVPAEQDTE